MAVSPISSAILPVDPELTRVLICNTVFVFIGYQLVFHDTLRATKDTSLFFFTFFCSVFSILCILRIKPPVGGGFFMRKTLFNFLYIQSSRSNVSCNGFFFLCLNHVGGGSGVTTLSGPVGVEKLTPWFVYAFVGMRTKVVALGLQQVGR